MANSAITFNTAGLASATSPGLVGTSAQTFAGVKTFQNGIVLGNETLSVYDEGVWTPSLTFGGNAVSLTYNKRYGHFTRIGNRCFFNCYILLSSKGSSVGSSVINGLPFTSATEANGGFASISIWSNQLSVTSGIITAYVNANATNIDMNYTSTSANFASAGSVTEGYWSNTASIMLAGSYVVA